MGIDISYNTIPGGFEISQDTSGNYYIDLGGGSDSSNNLTSGVYRYPIVQNARPLSFTNVGDFNSFLEDSFNDFLNFEYSEDTNKFTISQQGICFEGLITSKNVIRVTDRNNLLSWKINENNQDLSLDSNNYDLTSINNNFVEQFKAKFDTEDRYDIVISDPNTWSFTITPKSGNISRFDYLQFNSGSAYDLFGWNIGEVQLQNHEINSTNPIGILYFSDISLNRRLFSNTIYEDSTVEYSYLYGSKQTFSSLSELVEWINTYNVTNIDDPLYGYDINMTLGTNKILFRSTTKFQFTFDNCIILELLGFVNSVNNSISRDLYSYNRSVITNIPQKSGLTGRILNVESKYKNVDHNDRNILNSISIRPITQNYTDDINVEIPLAIFY